VFVVDAVRTPVGRFRGALADVRPDDLGAVVIGEVVRRAGADPAGIDDVFFGCANQAGEDNRNVARMSLLLAGLPVTVPGRDGEPAVRLRLQASSRRARDRRRRGRSGDRGSASNRCRARRW
jgi:acetyl-CoA acetyltransferase